MSALTDTYVSVIVLVRDHEGRILPFVEQVAACLSARYSNFEVILVDDGSLDESKSECMKAVSAYEGVRLIEFSRNFGDEAAYRAGLDNAIGDIVVTLSIDHESAEVIPTLVSACVAGAGIIAGIRAPNEQSSWLRRACSREYHRFLRDSLRIDAVPGASYCWAISRTAVNSLLAHQGVPQVLGLNLSQLGIPVKAVDLGECAGVRPRRRVFLYDLMLGLGVVLAHSRAPFRVLFVAANLFLGGLFGWLAFCSNMTTEVRGFGLTLIAGLLLLSLAIWVSLEYLIRNLHSITRGASYVIINEFSSGAFMRSVGRRNIVKD
jgi:hypothetical protein